MDFIFPDFCTQKHFFLKNKLGSPPLVDSITAILMHHGSVFVLTKKFVKLLYDGVV